MKVWRKFAFFLVSLVEGASALGAATVGIVQLVEHPALDKTREGIIETLEKRGVPRADIVWESAQGNAATAVQITKKFLGQEVKVIVPIATLPAQAALAQTKTVPIVFASVTDPVGAQLVGSNISGVSNFVDPQQHFAMMRKLYPQAKSVGVIYNPGEPNSVSLLPGMEAAARDFQFQLLTAGAMQTSEVVTATRSLLGKADVLFVNNDNTALAGFEAIVKAAKKVQTPVFASDLGVFELGADATLGPDQFNIGVEAGKMAAAILLDGKKPSELPVATNLPTTLRRR